MAPDAERLVKNAPKLKVFQPEREQPQMKNKFFLNEFIDFGLINGRC